MDTVWHRPAQYWLTWKRHADMLRPSPNHGTIRLPNDESLIMMESRSSFITIFFTAFYCVLRFTFAIAEQLCTANLIYFFNVTARIGANSTIHTTDTTCIPCFIT